MLRLSTGIALALLSITVVGCKEGAGSTPTIAAPSDRPATPAAKTPAPVVASASTSASSGLPALDDACSTDADCDLSYFDADCCMQCAGVPGNKSWIAKVSAFCAAHMKTDAGITCSPKACAREGSTDTPSTALGYLQAIPKCKAGHCG